MVMILLLAALQTIPEEYYEAAEVDGCNAWHGFWLITFPLLTPTLKTATILQSMSYFGMVTLIYTMTVGGPLDGTTTLSMRAYREAFQFWHMDKAAAYSVIIFLCNVLFSLIYLRTFKNKTV
jgi:ABC-type sugar transport system permease subunit